jgi:hypothetical protein
LRLTAALVAHELRIQRRSLRFRSFAAGYLALGCLPAVLIHLRHDRFNFAVGGATYAGETFAPLPLLTALLAGLLAMDGVSRERGSGAWTTATLTGVSNAGYLLRRWLALLAVILPLTALPPAVAAGLALADGGGPLTPAVFWGPWLLHVAPLAALASALALGLGTIGGNAVSTFLLALLVFGIVPAVGNEVLEIFRLRFDPPLGGLDLLSARLTVTRIALPKNPVWGWPFPMPVTESGFDLRTDAEQELAEGLLLLAAAAAVLGTAVLYLRRTRPDVRPQRVRTDHPLRNFLVAFGRLREQYKPDPKPAPADVAALALAWLVAAGAVAVEVGRAVHYEHRAAARWRAESFQVPAPTAVTVVPERWRIEGGFTASGEVAVRVAGTLRNAGREPSGHLAFSLSPGLEVAAVEPDQGRATVRRAWDRLTVDVEPPLPPGGSRTLRFRLAGRPGEPEFALPLWGEVPSFKTIYERHRNARFSHDRSDLSRSYEVPAISGHRVALTAPCLTPVPRYTPWTIERGFVPAEAYFPIAQVELSLTVPRDLLAADSCGGVSDPAAPQRAGRLRSRCVLPLSEVAVMGGGQRLLGADHPDGGGGTAVAVFPAHRANGELHLGFLQGGAKMVEEAWPGLGGMERTVVLEWPDRRVHERRMRPIYGDYRDPFAAWVGVTGHLVFLDEQDLIFTETLKPEPMVAEIVSARLARRRRLDPEQSLFFRQLFRQIVLQRLGLGPQTGALVLAERQYLPLLYQPAVKPDNYTYWSRRFPSLVVALTRRAGAEPLRAAIEELLAAGGDHAERPATFEEFAAILKRRSERPVDGMIRDFFLDGLLPELVLDHVQFLAAAGGWRVTGQVRNEGKGEAVCRLVLTTELGPVETEVRTGSGETASFALSTPHRPQGVFLDPDHECQRLGDTGAPRDRVYFQGGRR